MLHNVCKPFTFDVSKTSASADLPDGSVAVSSGTVALREPPPALFAMISKPSSRCSESEKSAEQVFCARVVIRDDADGIAEAAVSTSAPRVSGVSISLLRALRVLQQPQMHHSSSGATSATPPSATAGRSECDAHNLHVQLLELRSWQKLHVDAYIPPMLQQHEGLVVRLIDTFLNERRVMRRREVLFLALPSGASCVPVLLERRSQPNELYQCLQFQGVVKHYVLELHTQLCPQCRATDQVSLAHVLRVSATAQPESSLGVQHAPAVHLRVASIVRLRPTVEVRASLGDVVAWPVALIGFEFAAETGDDVITEPRGSLVVELIGHKQMVSVTTIPFAADDGWGCTPSLKDGTQGCTYPAGKSGPVRLSTRRRTTIVALTFLGGASSSLSDPPVEVVARWDPSLVACDAPTKPASQVKLSGVKQTKPAHDGVTARIYRDGFCIERDGVLTCDPVMFASSKYAASALYSLLSGTGDRSTSTVDRLLQEGFSEQESKRKCSLSLVLCDRLLSSDPAGKVFPGLGETCSGVKRF